MPVSSVTGLSLPHGVDETSVSTVRELLLEAHGAAHGAAGLGDLIVGAGGVPR